MKILDRYILSDYIKNFIIINFSFSLILVMVSVFDKLTRFIKYGASYQNAILYFLFDLPYLFTLTSPVAVLLASLFLMNKLSKYNESIAIRASGRSILRMVMPIFIFGFFYSFFIMWLGEFVLPKAINLREQTYVVKIRGGKMDDIRRRANINYKSSNNLFFNIGFFDGYSKKLYNIDIISYDEQTGGLKQTINAQSAFWEGDKWLFNDCYIRDFENGVPTYVEFYKSNKEIPIVEVKPIDFVKSSKKPLAMSYLELKQYIERQKKVGEKSLIEEVNLESKLAFPFVNFIILFFSVPLASASTRSKSRSIIFLVGLIVCFFYLSMLRVSQNLGYMGILTPFWAAWVPNIVFSSIGLWFVVRAEV